MKNEIKEKTVNKICDKYAVTKTIARDVYDMVLDDLYSEIESGNEINLGKIGKLTITDKNSRVAINPNTKEYIVTKPYKKIKFKISSSLKQKGYK